MGSMRTKTLAVVLLSVMLATIIPLGTSLSPASAASGDGLIYPGESSADVPAGYIPIWNAEDLKKIGVDPMYPMADVVENGVVVLEAKYIQMGDIDLEGFSIGFDLTLRVETTGTEVTIRLLYEGQPIKVSEGIIEINDNGVRLNDEDAVATFPFTGGSLTVIAGGVVSSENLVIGGESFAVSDTQEYTGSQVSVIGKTSEGNMIPIGASGNKAAPANFFGIYDGNFYSISNMEISAYGYKDVGLFAYANNSGGEIKNVNVSGIVTAISVNSNVMAAGGLIGRSLGLNVENCHTDVSVNATHMTDNPAINMGGLIGVGYVNHIIYCHSSGDVNIFSHASDISNGTSSFSTRIGGLIGEVAAPVTTLKTTIEYCYSEGNVTAMVKARTAGILCGGLAGSAPGYYNDVISRCYNAGNVTVYADTLIQSLTAAVGGISGRAFHGKVIDCYNSGDISVHTTGFFETCVGGISGEAYFGNISFVNCHSVGAIECESTSHNVYTGGICTFPMSSSYNPPDIHYSHFLSDDDLTGVVNDLRGNIENGSATPYSSELGDDEFRLIDTFFQGTENGVDGWDFSDVWYMSDNHPMLRFPWGIKATASDGGTISSAGLNIVWTGKSMTFQFTAESGYGLSKVLVDGSAVETNGSSYEFTDVMGSHTIHAVFGLPVTATFLDTDADSGTPPTVSDWYQYGTYTLPGIGTLARDGYTLSGWNDGSATYGVTDSYEANSTTVTFTPVWTPVVIPPVVPPVNVEFPITATADSGATISPSGEVMVARGADRTFTFSALPGHSIVSVIVDNVPLTPEDVALGSFTFNNVLRPHSIYVESNDPADLVLNITIDSGMGKALYSLDGVTFTEYTSTVSIPNNSTVTVRAEAADGYVFRAWWSGDDMYATSEATFSDVTSSLYLDLYFEDEPLASAPEDNTLLYILGAILLLAAGILLWFLLFYRRYCKVVLIDPSGEMVWKDRAHRGSEYTFSLEEGMSGAVTYRIGDEGVPKAILPDADNEYTIPKEDVIDRITIELR